MPQKALDQTETAHMASKWKLFTENRLTHTEAHYLMTIRTLVKTRGYARGVDVAQHLDLAKSTVSARLTKLIEKGWVEEDEARHLWLTDVGQQLAQAVVERRVTLRTFFEKVLGVDEELAELDACKVEHLLSLEINRRLKRLIDLLTEDEQIAGMLEDEFGGEVEVAR